MSAVSELKTITSIRDNLSVGLKSIQKEQLRIKKEIQEAKEVLKDTFGRKWSIKLQSIELLRYLRELGNEIRLLRKQLARMLQGTKSCKSGNEYRKTIFKIKLMVICTNPGKSIPCMKECDKSTEKQKSLGPIDNVIKYILDKVSLKEVKENIINLSKTAVKIPVSIAAWSIKKVFSVVRTLAKTVLAISAIFIFRKNDLFKKLAKTAFKLTFLANVPRTLRMLKPIFAILGRLTNIGMNINPKGIGGKLTGGLKAAGSSVLKFAKTGLLSIASLAAKGISEAVKSGAELEKQNLYMDQAIAANNPQMGSEEAKRQRDSYMKQLRDSAAGTGMDSEDTIVAGTQAVSIAGGDTKEAMELVKVAQDMAALNPGKTVAEAMEALETAKSGDMSGLEAFGAKATADDIGKLGIKGVVQQKLKPQFAGGAEKLSDTGAGLVSVIKGKLNNKMQDMGLGIIEKLKPALKSVVMLIDRYSPALDAFGGGIASGMGLAMNWVQNIVGLIGEKFGWIGEKTGFLKEVFQVSWAGIQDSMATAWGFIQPVMDLIANGVMLLFNVFQLFFPGIQAVIENVWAFVQPLLEGLGDAIGWVADKIGMVAEWFDKEPGGNGGGGGGTGAFGSRDEGSPLWSQTALSAGLADVQRMPTMAGASPERGNSVINNRPKSYMVPQANLPNSGANVQNQAINININGVNKSTNEIMSEMMPKLRLALQNMSPGSSGHARIGGSLA